MCGFQASRWNAGNPRRDAITCCDHYETAGFAAFYLYRFLHSANTTWQVFGVPPERPA
jgi:hypothetical protein